jgi:hypothetical protein
LETFYFSLLAKTLADEKSNMKQEKNRKTNTFSFQEAHQEF